jgi:hypothetical protein
MYWILCGWYALCLECRVLHNATLRLSRSVREPHRGKPASIFPLHYFTRRRAGSRFSGCESEEEGDAGDESKAKQDERGPLGKPTGREELGKCQGEAEPGGPDGADDLAVPDYVMRDFGSSENENQDNGIQT